MQRITLSGNSVAVNLTGFLSNATGATWTLTATDSADSLAHLVTIRNDTATDHSGKTALLTGTNANGHVLTETITLPAGAATVTSTAYFKTLTTVVPSATIGADTMDIGWSASSTTSWYFPPNTNTPEFNIGIGCRVVSGAPTYAVQHTFDGTAWFNHPIITGQTVSYDGDYTTPVTAIRLQFTAAGEVSLFGIQVGA